MNLLKASSEEAATLALQHCREHCDRDGLQPTETLNSRPGTQRGLYGNMKDEFPRSLSAKPHEPSVDSSKASLRDKNNSTVIPLAEGSLNLAKDPMADDRPRIIVPPLQLSGLQLNSSDLREKYPQPTSSRRTSVDSSLATTHLQACPSLRGKAVLPSCTPDEGNEEAAASFEGPKFPVDIVFVFEPELEDLLTPEERLILEENPAEAKSFAPISRHRGIVLLERLLLVLTLG